MKDRLMKIWISIAGLLGLQAVISASFGAHGGLADWEKTLLIKLLIFS
jgi:phage tail protein X